MPHPLPERAGPRVRRVPLSNLSFGRSCAWRRMGGMSAPGAAAGGGSMPVFTPPKTLRKNQHRANRSGRQTPRRSTPSLARLVTRFAPCRCPIMSSLSNLASRPVPGLDPPGFPLPVLGIPSALLRSPLHNETLCKLPLRRPPPSTQTLTGSRARPAQAPSSRPASCSPLRG